MLSASIEASNMGAMSAAEYPASPHPISVTRKILSLFSFAYAMNSCTYLCILDLLVSSRLRPLSGSRTGCLPFRSRSAFGAVSQGGLCGPLSVPPSLVWPNTNTSSPEKSGRGLESFAWFSLSIMRRRFPAFAEPRAHARDRDDEFMK